MKHRRIILLTAALGLLLAGRATAQISSRLYNFTATQTNLSGVYTNSDGANPDGALIFSGNGNALYGTTLSGGKFGLGTVFTVNTNGSGFTNLRSFNVSDGAHPDCGLLLSHDNLTLYGTTQSGGSSGLGTVFAISTDANDFTTLHSFTNGSDGQYPVGELVFSANSNILYGVSGSGSLYGYGSVFALNTDGTGFTNLHSFNFSIEGAYPYAGLLLSGNTLYGTTSYGVGSFGGTIFKVNTDGTGFSTLHVFAGGPGDGSYPVAELILSGNTLYGTTSQGGSSGYGTLFKVNTNGSGFTTLYNFNDSDANVYPNSKLILSGNLLYGMAVQITNNAVRTVFSIKTNGTSFTSLYSFAGGSGGMRSGGLILSGDILYATAYQGGSMNKGLVFKLDLSVSPPLLSLTRRSNQLVMTWANTNFTLQSAPLVTGTYTNIPGATNSPYTNPITGTQQFFRLIGN